MTRGWVSRERIAVSRGVSLCLTSNFGKRVKVSGALSLYFDTCTANTPISISCCEVPAPTPCPRDRLQRAARHVYRSAKVGFWEHGGTDSIPAPRRVLPVPCHLAMCRISSSMSIFVGLAAAFLSAQGIAEPLVPPLSCRVLGGAS